MKGEENGVVETANCANVDSDQAVVFGLTAEAQYHTILSFFMTASARYSKPIRTE